MENKLENLKIAMIGLIILFLMVLMFSLSLAEDLRDKKIDLNEANGEVLRLQQLLALKQAKIDTFRLIQQEYKSFDSNIKYNSK